MSRTIEVVVEIPKGSRNKYEIDHDKHIVRLDRRLFSALTYPADYGFIPDTLAEDDDPLDVLVLLEDGTVPGCYIEARPLGILWMSDEKGPDAKIICVVDGDPMYNHIESLDGLPQHLLAEIRHFFDTYKDLEPNKEASTKGYEGVDAAWSEIEQSQKRYESSLASA